MHNKTAVHLVLDLIHNLHSENIIDYTTKELILEDINEILEVEKHQIMDAFIGYDIKTPSLENLAKEYYNETFNTKP